MHALRLGAQLGGRHRELVRVLLGPRRTIGERDLRMELDPPGRPTVEPERLRADVAACELDAALREVERVVVPLEDRGARRAGRRARRRRRPAGVSETSSQPISGALAGRTARAGGAREHLRAEADPEDRDPGREHVREELLLVREPVEAVVLVRVHRAAEDHDGVVARRPDRACRLRAPASARGCGRRPRRPRRRRRPARSGRG